ncbi:MAG: Histidinol-phosphatase [Candidatus Anoxychlamydiales bacterium]|nr:Histidinol-phosphatase [Candidatus Anoxychlamydiales bacterium]
MLFSYHNHSTYSDGNSNIDDIIKEAINLNLDEVGISDHFHIPKKNGYVFQSDMEINKLDRYVKDVLKYKNLKKPKVKLGLEVEYVKETLEEFKAIIKKYPFDYLIASIHLVNKIIVVDENSYKPKNFTTDIMIEYWIKIKELAKSKAFDIIGHIDLYKKHGHKPQVELDNYIEDALNAIKDAGMSVEVNTSGFFFPCKEQYPSIEILKKIKEKDISVLINADAHHPSNLIREFKKARQILKKIGFEKLAKYNKRKKRLVSF